MNNLPLQPLVWDWSYGDGGKTSAVCRAKSLSHEYIVRLEQCGYCYVDYRKFDNDEDSDNRKDEPPEFNSVKEAQYWVDNTHYPHTMKPYVKPMPTWISVDDRLPEDDGKYLVATSCGKQWMGNYNLPPKPNEWMLNGWSMNGGWHPFDITHWMPLPDAPKEIDCE